MGNAILLKGASDLLNEGAVLLDQGQLEAARYKLSRCIEIYEEHAPGCENLATAYLIYGLVFAKQGFFEHAKSYGNQSLEILSERAPGSELTASAYVLLAGCYAHLKEWEDSIRFAELALVILDRHPMEHSQERQQTLEIINACRDQLLIRDLEDIVLDAFASTNTVGESVANEIPIQAGSKQADARNRRDSTRTEVPQGSLSHHDTRRLLESQCHTVAPSEQLPVDEMKARFGSHRPFDVFLVHAGPQKRDHASTMKAIFESNRLHCFLDAGMETGGGSPRDQMRLALETCRHVVVVLSKAFLEPDRKSPREELEYAFRRAMWIRQNCQEWESMWVVMFDLSVFDYNKARKSRRVLRLPHLAHEKVLFEWTEGKKGPYDDWAHVCHAVKAGIIKEDSNGAVQQWRKLLLQFRNDLPANFPSPRSLYGGNSTLGEFLKTFATEQTKAPSTFSRKPPAAPSSGPSLWSPSSEFPGNRKTARSGGFPAAVGESKGRGSTLSRAGQVPGFDLDAANGDDDVVLELGGGVTRVSVVDENQCVLKGSNHVGENHPTPPDESRANPYAGGVSVLGGATHPYAGYDQAASPSAVDTLNTPPTLDVPPTAVQVIKEPVSSMCPPLASAQSDDKTNDGSKDVMKVAMDYKQQGNQAFKEENWQLATEFYSKAIESTPGMTSEELLKLLDKWQHEQRTEMQRQLHQQEQPSKQFKAPPHPYGTELAIFHCNRAASLLHMEEYEKAIQDSTVAILWHQTYIKAYVRRSTSYELQDDTEHALEDAEHAQQLDPTNTDIQQRVARLQKLEVARLEKLKDETLEKLKRFSAVESAVEGRRVSGSKVPVASLDNPSYRATASTVTSTEIPVDEIEDNRDDLRIPFLPGSNPNGIESEANVSFCERFFGRRLKHE